MPTQRTGEIRLRRLVSTTATASLVAAHTVEDQYIAEVTQVTATNTDATSIHTITVKLGGRSIFSAARLGPAGGAENTIDWTGAHYLHSGEAISIQADAPSVVEVYVSGGSRKDT